VSPERFSTPSPGSGRRITAAPSPVAIVAYFRVLDDPRIERCRLPRLLDIVVLTPCAVVCGADTCALGKKLGKARYSWLGRFLALPPRDSLP
jgi:DDE_Tnp_1-associated